MDRDIEISRRRISRRRALTLGGTVGLGGVLVACGADSAPPVTATATGTPAVGGAAALLGQASQCVLSKEETQGPYWFDVDSIRSDIREDRPGATFELALRALDCSSSGPIANAVIEIWHCDAGGMYSGFESGSAGGPGGGAPPGPPPSGGAPSGGAPSGSDGNDQEATPTDDGTYLRGAQTTDKDGIVTFTTIFPGWYRGRTTHIHVKVHIDKKTVLTTQLFFDEALLNTVNAAAPYSSHTGRESSTTNAQDSIYDATGLVTVKQNGSSYLGAINLGIDV